MFAEGGFGRATVDEVAQRAEVGKGTIYLYFENKEAILAELVLQALSELATLLQAACDASATLDPEQQLREMAAAYLAFAREQPDYFRLLNAFDHGGFQDGISPERREQILVESNRTLDLVARVIADGMARGTFAPGDARQAASVLWASLNGALALMSHPIRRQMIHADAPELYGATLALCLRGLSHRG